MTDDQNVATGLAREDAPSLADLATPEEGAGAWPDGWYRAVVVAGYTTGRGKVMETTDSISKDQASRNLHIALKLDGSAYVPSTARVSDRKLTQGPGGERQMRATFNYRPDDFTPGRIAQVKEARERFKGVQGAWPDKAIQSSSLSLGRLGQLEKAIGFKLPFVNGRLNPQPFVGQRLDVRLKLDATSGFSEVAAVAQAGAHVK